jgi:15-cis-phytoene synthase
MTMTADHAMSVLRSKGRSFYFASRLLSPVHRTRAATLYAFCRYVDDLADEMPDPEQAMAKLEQVKIDLQSGQSRQLCVTNLLALMDEALIPPEPVMALIEGVSSDVHLTSIRTEVELIRYAYQVAGTVGVMMSMLLDVHERQAWPFAIDLGIAMQLTNIARDVGEDARKGRVYLPQAWIGFTDPKDIVLPDDGTTKKLREGTRRLLRLAEHYYNSGLSGVGFLPNSARYGIVVAAMVYREIGQVIEQTNFQSWDRRAVVAQSRKLVCASKALTNQALGTLSGTAVCAHDGRLHEHLQDCFGADTTALA